MTHKLLLLAAMAATAGSAMAVEAATRAYPVSGFTKLRVEGPYTVRVHTGDRPSVAARGPQDRLAKLVVEQRGDTLIVSTEKGWSWSGWKWGKDDNVTLDISVPMLNAAALTGSGEVVVDTVRTPAFEALLTGSGDLTISRLETRNLTAGLTGSGDLTITGRADSAHASVRGSGDLHGGGLAVRTLDATVTGSGDLAIGPTQIANARVTGSGDIAIAGRPRCTTKKTGSGEIRCGG